MAFKKKILIFLIAVVIASNAAGDLTSSEKTAITAGFTTGEKIAETIAKFQDPKTSKVFGVIDKMTSFLGAAGGFVSLILAFLPQQDSAELAYMKKQFTLVNTKLDKITSELDNIKGLITYENQRAAYHSSAHAILFGHKQMMRLFNELQKTRCTTKANCKRIRTRIAQRYIASLNVKVHLDKILHGSSKPTSSFGDPLLLLVKKTFKCDISKINQFANGVFKLAFKGQQVVLLYEKLTGSKHSITQSMNDWLKSIYDLRGMSWKMKQQCFNNIKTQMIKDIRNSKYQIGSKTNAIANAKVKRFLELKYPWLDVVAFSYDAYGRDNHCTTNVYGAFWYMPSDRNARKRNLIVSFADKTGTYDRQKYDILNGLHDIVTRRALFRTSRDYCKTLDAIRQHLKMKNLWKYVVSLTVRKNYGGFAVGKTSDLKIVNKKYTIRYKVNRRKTRSFPAYIVVVLKSTEQAKRRGCILACKNQGQCKQYPYSSAQYCECKPFYEGNLCEKHSKAALAKTIDMMVTTTLQIPVLSDVYFDIKDLRRFVGINFVNIQKGISNLEASIQRKFNSLSIGIGNQFKWANFITQYKDSIHTIEYFSHRFEQLPVEHKDEKSLQVAGKTLANEVLHVSRGIRKPLFLLNQMLVGKLNKPLLRHKPLLLAFMETKNKAGEPCTSAYKRRVDNYWRQLILLQQIGYMVWAQALEFVGRKTNIVDQFYKQRIAAQLASIKGKTCQYTIANSANIHCKGHYLHPGMQITNRCNRNYYVVGSKRTSCRRKVSGCNRCRCYRRGSRTTQCSNYNGRCHCKRGFYGNHCGNRNCVWGHWSRYGHCLRCGYGARKQRHRGIRIHKLGSGRRCYGSRYSYAPCFRGCCRNQYHCSRRRKCIPSYQRCNYDNNCGDKQDERYCNERCFWRYTGLNGYGGGRVVYLDRQRPYCPSGSVMKSFGLQNIGSRIRYRFICCRLNKYICYNRAKYNTYSYAVHNSRGQTLARQPVHCPGSAYLSGFRLSRNRHGNRIRYIYNCCYLRFYRHRKRSTCYSRHTRWTNDGKGNIIYLNRQYVTCGPRYFLSYFRLQHRRGKWWGAGSFRYHYRCCKINP
ncbi:uncharacterized protein LOC135694543 [Rhopilema esculentum]|uniref:uncharacterized protein LOC135694543 n=1 Tax=Rhopilema esculentum TaxID=499914 RepID=UPI0031DB7713